MILFVILLFILFISQLSFLMTFETNVKWSYTYTRLTDHNYKIKKKGLNPKRSTEYHKYLLYDLLFYAIILYSMIFCTYSSLIHAPSDLWFFISGMFLFPVIPLLIKPYFAKKEKYKAYYYATFAEKILFIYNLPLIILAIILN